jgi:hypothetical protein
MTEREAATKLWPTYALRVWMTTLLRYTERASDDLDARIEFHEKEIARLRAQKERCSIVITAIGEAIGSVDKVLRRIRDTDAQTVSAPKVTEDLEGTKRETKRQTPPSDKLQR